jgi:hypothetical protein
VVCLLLEFLVMQAQRSIAMGAAAVEVIGIPRFARNDN